MSPREKNGDQGCPWQVTSTRGSDNFEIILNLMARSTQAHCGPGDLEATDSPGGPQRRTFLEEDACGCGPADVQDPGRHPAWPSLRILLRLSKDL